MAGYMRSPYNFPQYSSKRVSSNEGQAAAMQILTKAEQSVNPYAPESGSYEEQVAEEAVGVMAMFVNPRDCDVVRPLFQNGGGSRTAVNQGKIDTPMTYDPADVSTGQQLPAGTSGFALFRDGLRAAVVYIQNTGLSPNFSYSALFPPLPGGTSQSVSFTLAPFGATLFYPVWFAPSAGTVQPHGDRLFTGELKNTRWGYGFWIDASAAHTSSITWTYTATTTVAINVNLYLYNGSEMFDPIQSINDPATAGPWTSVGFTGIAQSGYYTLEWVPEARAAGILTPITITNVTFSVTNNSIWSHVAIPSMQDNPNFFAGYRVLAADAWAMNKSPYISISGDLTGVQSPSNYDWFTVYANGAKGLFDTILNTQQRVMMDWKFGCKTYIKPAGDKDFKWKDNIQQGNGGSVVTKSTFPLKNVSDYIIIAVRSTAAGSGAGQLSLGYAIEYKSTNQLASLIPPTVKPKAWKIAMRQIPFADQFVPNKAHWLRFLGTVLQTFKSGARIAAKLANLIPPGVKLYGVDVGPAVAMAANQAANIMDAFGGQEEGGDGQNDGNTQVTL